VPEPIIDLGEVWEGDTQTIEFDIVDQDSVGFKPTTLTLTVRDRESGTLVKAETNILANCDASGNVLYEIPPAETTLATQLRRKASGFHQFIFKWTWDTSPTKQKTEVAQVEVKPI